MSSSILNNRAHPKWRGASTHGLSQNGQFKLNLERLEARQLLASDLLITEFMASNQGTLDDENGDSSDWVEVHNTSDTAIDLAGYRLTDAADTLDKWVFPSVMMQPGDYLLVFASGQEEEGEKTGQINTLTLESGESVRALADHLPYKLDADGEYVALVDPSGTVISEYGSGTVEYPEQLTDVSYGVAQTTTVVNADSDVHYMIPLQDIGTDWATPGFDAQSAGFSEGKAALGFEERPGNRNSFDGEISTELPAGTHAVYARTEFDLASASDISGMNLRLKYDNGVIVYLNGQEVLTENAPANPQWFSTAETSSPRDSEALQFSDFSLTDHVDKLVDGTNVLAIHAMDYIGDKSDFLVVPELVLSSVDMEAAFGIPAALGYMLEPTPGAANVSSDRVFPGFVSDVEMSVDSGFYDSQFEVELTTTSENSTIYYTTDSSRPSATNGQPYTGPITIDTTTVLRASAVQGDLIPSGIATSSYIFLDDVLTQNGAGLPRTWGVMGNSNGGFSVGDPVPANYAMDRQVVNDPRYRDTIKDDLRSVPAITLVLDPEDLWDEENGIYSNSLSEGRAWERPVSVELINTDGEIEFDVEAGTRMHGGWGRRPSQSNKHSFRLLFRSEYGEPKLNYPMFGEDATDSFDTFVLRANFNHSWATGGDTATTFINDQWAAETQLEMGWAGPHSNWAHLFLNGLYWGLYNPMERPSAPFAADYFGGDKDEYDVLVVGTPTDGDSAAWNELTRRARGNDYEAVEEMLDIDAAIDYFITNQYCGNWDWPQNNWYGSRRRVDGAKWYFHSWDAEGCFGRGLTENRVNQSGGALGGLIQSLRTNFEEFRVRYADRIHKHMFNDGLLTAGANIDRLNRLAAPIDRAVVGESARWGDGRWDQVNPARTRDDHWLPRLENLRTVYFPERGERVLDQFRNVDLYPATDAPELNRHGGAVEEGFLLDFQNPNGVGTIYYTLDGTDPRLRGGDISPEALVFDGTPMPVNGPTSVFARVLNNGQWSASTEAQFVVTDLRITEINYHPQDAGAGELDVDNSQFEFIELFNAGTVDVDLSGAYFSQGISHEFPNGSVLAPGARAVLVNNREAFESRYGTGVNIIGEFLGDFSDFGETVELRDRIDASVARFSYQVAGDWPSRANGQGSSLELVDTQGSYLDPSNWRPSSELGGSPAVAGSGPGEIVINEVLGYGNSANDDMLELFNSSGGPVDIGNWFLGNPGGDPFRYQFPSTTTIPGQGFLVLSETDLGFGFNFGEGDSISLIEADRDGTARRFVDQVEFGPALAGISLGPWPDRASPVVALAESTLGAPNTGRRVSDVIISELNFDPLDMDGERGQRADNFEYLELYNTTDQTVDIGDWRLSGSLEFTFDPGTTIAAGDNALLVRFSSSSTATVFKFVYGIDLDKPLLSRYRQRLPNDKGEILLEQPSGVGNNFVYVDEVVYDSRPPFPVGANMTGSSFTRATPVGLGDTPSTWIVAPASPGEVEFPEQKLVGDSNADGEFNQLDIVAILTAAKYLTGEPATFAEGDWNEDGLFNQLDIVAALQSGNYLAGANAVVAPDSFGNLAKSGSDDDDAAIDEVFAALGSSPVL